MATLALPAIPDHRAGTEGYVDSVTPMLSLCFRTCQEKDLNHQVMLGLKTLNPHLQNSRKCALGYNDPLLLHVTPPGWTGKVSKVQNDTGSRLKMIGVMIGSTNTTVTNVYIYMYMHIYIRYIHVIIDVIIVAVLRWHPNSKP